jgi:hypothetical protein
MLLNGMLHGGKETEGERDPAVPPVEKIKKS